MEHPLYSTPEGQTQIVYVHHLSTNRPLFSLPSGDYLMLTHRRPDRVQLEMGEGWTFADLVSRLPVLAFMLLGRDGVPVQFVNGHTGDVLATSTTSCV